jgi:NADH-quinone oxidoreductase subunit N
MTAADLKALLPLLSVAGAAILAMLGIALRRHHGQTAAIALAGLAAAFASLWMAADGAPRSIPPLLTVDRYALFYMGLILAASATFVLLAYDYFARCEGDPEELYVLMLVATLGALVLVASSHLISLFLGLELLSVALYGMIAYLRTRPLPLEAGLKYLVLAAISAAFLLFGIAIIYAALGTMELSRLATEFLTAPALDRRLVLSGLALVVTGLGFKLAVVPFHLWTPDVYEGAPAPVTAYIATVSKGAIFAVLLRYFHGRILTTPSVFLLFAAIAMASMIAGNLLALLQVNLKRILAYSSIAHLGYILVAFEAGGNLGAAAVTFYLAAYFVTTLGAFGVISILSNGEKEPATIDAYRGLFWRRPALAVVFTAMLLSLAGIPLTAGFISKFYVLAAGASSARWTLILTLVFTSAIGLYYYLRVVTALYGRTEKPISHSPLPLIPTVLLAGLMLLLIWLGVFPGGLLRLIHAAVAGLA